ncbi:MAG: hypothetical protein ABIJ23_05235 [Candidatus Magasanikbacteria bacterium]
MDKNLLIMEKVVLDMGGTIEEFVPQRNCLYINIFGRRILIEQDITITRRSYVSAQLTKCKEITYKLLRASNLPSPKTICLYYQSYNRGEAIKKLNKLKYPIILKKATGSNSRGIFTNIGNSKEAIKIFEKNLPRYKSMIAQEMVFGKEYRVLVLGEKVIGALEMIHPHIVGDGVSTIKKIIKRKQLTTEKQTKFDKTLKQFLKSQKVSLGTILPKKKIIYFKNNSCLAEGGETQDVTDIVHKDVKNICVSASKVVGKYLVGIDVICKDISKPQTKKSFNILEINGKPDLYIHYNPTNGKTRNVLKDIIKFLVKASTPLLPDND